MFEDSLVESRVGHVSSSKRWTTLASISLQVAVAGVVIALPLLHPEALPFHVDAPRVSMPLLAKPPVPVVRVEGASSASPSMAAPSVTRAVIFPSLLPTARPSGEAPTLVPIGSGMGMPDGLPSGIGIGDGHGPSVSVAPVKAVAPIRPAYPPIAKAAHVEGAVIVEAIISRTGTIESLHVVSGPPMLQSAAIDAIREARYLPFLLNGEPVEVQTRITVNFRIGG